VKALARWIVEGLCSSEGMSVHRRVSETRKRKPKDSYGMVAAIRRVCQMEQSVELFSEASLWNREIDFQLQYEYQNWCWKVEHQMDNKISIDLDIFK
jgi:hypothetical protein